MPSLGRMTGNHNIRNVLREQCVRCTEIIAIIADIGNVQMRAWISKREWSVFLAGVDTAKQNPTFK